MRVLMVSLLFLAGAATPFVVPGQRTFDGYKVYRLIARTRQQLNLLGKLLEESDMDFWTLPRLRGNTDIMVNSEQAKELFKVIEDHGIDNSVLINEVQSVVANQKASLVKAGSTPMDWTTYHTYAEIMEWLDKLSAEYKNIVTVTKIGASTEGKLIKVVKVSTGGLGKQAIVVDSMYHAREWISSAFTTYFINELLKEANKSELLDKFDFYIVPIVNPDGYSYSFSTDRLWRKTRSDHVSPRKCKGVDPNRNFGYKYGGSGTSTDKCSEIYRGPEAFSEPETQAIRDLILGLGNGCKAYMTFHSYGQYLLTPWGYTTDVPEDYPELIRVGTVSKDIFERKGSIYTLGSSTNVLYAAAGGSDDWAKGAGGCKYAFTVELRDTGKNGFLLPQSEIIPTCEETWPAIREGLLSMQ